MEQQKRRPAVATRQPASHSSAKRANATTSKVSIYANPLPLYVHDEAASTIFALAWTISVSARTLLGKAPRNPIDKFAYLNEKLVGVWDDATKSVWVQPISRKGKEPQRDTTAWMNLLWTRGFFGKGSLSRSEPTWFQREKNRVTGAHVLTAEDITRQRREERKVLKLQKAQERADEREKQVAALGSLQQEDIAAQAPGSTLEDIANDVQPVIAASKPKTSKFTGVSAKEQQRQLEESGLEVQNLEHMQLQREEAFFLVFASGVLDIYSKDADNPARPLSLGQVWRLFQHSSLPRQNPYAEDRMLVRPDNPFILSYVVYHHYRSLGWVVRNGVKFCVDWVLYKGSDGTKNMRGGAGPVGGHAEFSVVIIPTYESEFDAKAKYAHNAKLDWRWLNTVNRVNSGVKKTVILAFVTIPYFEPSHCGRSRGEYFDLHEPDCLARYSVKEVSIKRFIPTRLRD